MIIHNNISSKSNFNEAITALTHNIYSLEQELAKPSNCYTAPEVEIFIRYSDSQEPLFSTRENAVKALRAQKERLEILKKMQKGLTIDSEEHNFLLLLPVCRKIPVIVNYPNICIADSLTLNYVT